MTYDILACALHTIRKNWGIRFFILIFILLFANAQAVFAEGSRELNDDPVGDGNRPFTEWDTNLSAGLQRRTLIRVYVNAGEYVNLGSSVFASYSAGMDIVYRSPIGGQDGSCDVIQNGFGHIATLAMEAIGPAGTLVNPGGYQPCQFQATETGVYEVEFRGPLVASTGNPPSTTTGAAFPVVGTFATVAAWDVTVWANADDPLSAIPGRAFTNLLALNLSNLAGRLNSTIYVLTHDGYQYRLFLNGVQPFGFLVFSNTKGPVDSVTNDPLYYSVQLTGGNLVQALPPGIDIRNPNAANLPDSNDFTHKIFFNVPAADLPSPPPGDPTSFVTVPSASGPIGFRTIPLPPPLATDFRFEGSEADTDGQMGTSPLGGFFRFTSNRTGSYQIRIDVNNNGSFADDVDVILTGTALVGVNEKFWNGLDGLGAPVPASTVAYEAELETRGGEVHFPFADPENNRRGFVIERLNDPGTNPGAPSPFQIYYNDALNYDGNPANYNYSLCAAGETPIPPDVGATPGACYGTGPTPRRADVIGVNSTLGLAGPGWGAHRWVMDFGDERIMNTWTFFPSERTSLSNGILVSLVDLVIVKTADRPQYTPGGPIQFTLTVTNAGPNDANGATVTDVFPAYLTGVTWSCQATGNAACTAGGAATANGVGNINETVNIAAGAGNQLVYTIDATVDATAPNPIENTGRVVRPPDTNETNLTNNESTVTVPAITVPTMTVSKDDGRTQVSAAGEQTTYTIIYTNTSNVDALNVTLSDDLPAGATFVSCSNACVGTGPVTWNIGTVLANASGQVTLTVDLPALAPPGQHINTVTLNYTDSGGNAQPPEVDTDINTTVVAAVPTMTVSKDDGRTLVSSDGEQTTYTIIYTNTSNVDALNVTLSDDLPAGATFVSCSNGCAGTGPVTWNIGTVLANASGQVTLTVDLPAAPAGTQHVNTVTLNYTDSGGNAQPPEIDTDINTVTTPANLVPRMTISKDDGRTVVSAAGEQTTYIILYRNIGDADAVNTIIIDTLPAGATFVSCNPVCSSTGTGTVTWDIGTVAPNGGGSLALTVDLPAIDPPAQHLNTVQVTYTDTSNNVYPPETDTDINTVLIFDPSQTRMIVNKDDGRTVVSAAGDQTTYTITYTNISTQLAVDVSMSDTLPVGATFVACSGGCTVVNASTVEWIIGNVAAGASGSVTLTVNLPPLAPPGEHLNTVTLRYTDSNGTVYPDETDTDINIVETGINPNPTVTPTVTGTPPTSTPFGTPPPDQTPTPFGTPPPDQQTPTPFGTPPPDQQTPTPFGTPPPDTIVRKNVNPPFVGSDGRAEWTIIITNPGNTPLENITVRDNLPPGLEFIDASTSGGELTVSGSDVIVEVPLLEPGGSITITIVTRVGDNASSLIENRVSVFIPPDTLETDGAMLVIASELPRTGETPLWATLLRWALMLSLGMAGLTMIGWWGRRYTRR